MSQNRDLILQGMLICLLFWQQPSPIQDRVTEAEQILRRASALFDQRRFEEAALEARKARDANPELLGAWKLSGLSLQLTGKMEEAEKEFSDAVQRFPKDADLWFYLSRVQYLQSKLKLSEVSVRRALALHIDHAGAHTQLGMTLEALNDFPNALIHYQRGAELNRALPRPQVLPLVYAGNLLFKLERYEEALDYFSRAAAIDPRSGEVMFERGRALEKLGKLKEAEDAYNRTVQLNGHDQARAALGRLRAGVVTSAKRPKPLATHSPIRFRETAQEAKLDFVLRNGASPRKYQVETMTGGVAVIDF